jgi:hypothetical protein
VIGVGAGPGSDAALARGEQIGDDLARSWGGVRDRSPYGGDDPGASDCAHKPFAAYAKVTVVRRARSGIELQRLRRLARQRVVRPARRGRPRERARCVLFRMRTWSVDHKADSRANAIRFRGLALRSRAARRRPTTTRLFKI